MKFKPVHFIILLLTLISFQTLSRYSIFNNVPLRLELQTSILSGEMEAPYQYRLMEPVPGYLIEKLTSHIIPDRIINHVFVYQLLMFFTFLFIYIMFYKYLKLFFSDQTCIIGLILLCILIPLGITSIWEDGDYFTLLFYLIGLNLIFRSKEIYLPFVILLGEFNRDQIIFLLIIYLCYALSKRELFKPKTILVAAACIALWAGAYYMMRLIFGFKESKYTVAWNTGHNLSMIPQIINLWTVMVIPFLVLSALSFRRSSAFFRYAFIAILFYIVIFFFNGFMTQMAKFLPAYLVLIPMSLQFLTNEFTSKDNFEGKLMTGNAH